MDFHGRAFLTSFTNLSGNYHGGLMISYVSLLGLHLCFFIILFTLSIFRLHPLCYHHPTLSRCPSITRLVCNYRSVVFLPIYQLTVALLDDAQLICLTEANKQLGPSSQWKGMANCYLQHARRQGISGKTQGVSSSVPCPRGSTSRRLFATGVDRRLRLPFATSRFTDGRMSWFIIFPRVDLLYIAFILESLKVLFR